MRVLPVIDLLHGQVVRGVGGRRETYRPIVSRLTPSSEPVAVAEAFREHFGLDTLYLADLDAIAGAAPRVALYRELQQLGFQLWVDAGVSAVHALAAAGVETIVAGLESLLGPDTLRALLDRFAPERIVFSLDLKHGAPLGCWDLSNPWHIAEQAIALGVRRILVLDLAGVGENQGVTTEALCGRLRKQDAQLEIATGGGVRGQADLRRLQDLGVDVALVASALHDGRIAGDALTWL